MHSDEEVIPENCELLRLDYIYPGHKGIIVMNSKDSPRISASCTNIIKRHKMEELANEKHRLPTQLSRYEDEFWECSLLANCYPEALSPRI